MNYLDVFILPLPKKNLARYKAFAKLACDVWMDHGALQYVETLGNDVPDGKLTSLPLSVKLGPGEIVGLGYAVYKSRAHRDQVAKKVYADPRMQFDWKQAPFDGQRMIFGGFEQIIGAQANAKAGKAAAKAAPKSAKAKSAKAKAPAPKSAAKAKAPSKRAKKK